ncbi:AraC family transcriptional regulator [Microbacterium neimengense]
MTERVRAWRPGVPLVQEVLHATFAEHAYPAHTHNAWTVLSIDTGAVVYDLDGRRQHADASSVTILPPHIPHDGRSETRGAAFRKRVLYLEESWLPAGLIGSSARRPSLTGTHLRAVLEQIHHSLRTPGDALVAEGTVLRLGDLIQRQLGTEIVTRADAPLARRLRSLLDDRLTDAFTIDEAARLLGTHPSHLVRVFSGAYGIPPHRYVIGRRIDRARRLLLAGVSPADTAARSGFHDQAHLTRHFRRTLGTTPAAFAA